MIGKFFTNIILVRNENIGINGAAIGNIICNLIVFAIGLTVLIKNIKLKLSLKNFILKPFFATFIMSVVAIFINFLLEGVIPQKIATMLSILTATGAYGVSIVALKLVKKY